jgi:hypothetical protein
LTPHSLSRRVRDSLAGNLGAHRHLPVDRNKDAEPEAPKQVPVVERRLYSSEDARRAWLRRHADLQDLNGVNDQLEDVDRRVNALNRRAAALLDAETICRQMDVGVI